MSVLEGVHLSMPESEYHADPCPSPSLSVSIAKVLLNESPRHAWLAHPKLGGKQHASSDTMDLGSLAHKLMLGKGSDIHAVQADDFRTKSAREERDYYREQGSIVVLQRQLDEAPAIADAWRSNLFNNHGVTIPEATEATMIWSECGTWFRARADAIDQELLVIYDLKRTQIPHNKRSIERHFASMDYAIQAAAYNRGAERTHYETIGRWKFRFLCLEPTPPYSATPVDVDKTFLDLGGLKWDRASQTWGRCVAKNDWPYPAPVTVSARTWDVTEEAEKTYADL